MIDLTEIMCSMILDLVQLEESCVRMYVRRALGNVRTGKVGIGGNSMNRIILKI